ncbi:MAG: hypothetical protein MRZ79_26155 [Bacteroidia bacterium]|nr:hypothetical protein [Bacteroidia bacterium]
MNHRARSIITDVVLGISIIAIHLGLRFLFGNLVSYISTVILSFWVGYLRPGGSEANSFPQWMLINFWFFIYFPMAINGSSESWMFLLASYGASGLGFITNKLTAQLLRSLSLGIAIVLSLGLAALGWVGSIKEFL